MIKFEDYKQYLSPVFYKQTNLVAKSASGCYLTDVNGDRYLDFVQGIAVNALGHNYPTVVKAIQEQAGNLVNASFNLVNYESTLTLAKRLSEKAPGKLSSIFFSNGGAEATDSALKLAMSYSARSAVIAFMGSFHGRTVGATAITGSIPNTAGITIHSWEMCILLHIRERISARRDLVRKSGRTTHCLN